MSLTIVALGASAGGLEALQGFFAGMPVDPRFAFVVITHLAPQHESRMAEVLRRATSMPVSEAQDAEQIAPGHVYVIPPNRLMGIRDGRLRLERAAPRPAIPHPIDFFMGALAEDQQERSAGIVFSGADHDGTAGLKEIKAAGGLAIVQDPGTAQFPGMPRSAIDAAVPDAVLPVEKMGQALIDYVEHAPEAIVVDAAPVVSDPAEDGSLPARLPQILALVYERCGKDFRWYRPAMLLRRLRRRMGLTSVRDVDSYVALLKESENELRSLVKDFLINVTEFFRQPDAWKVLEEQVLPELVAERLAAGAGVRVWTPGCATGEESYSIAMLLLERLGERSREATVNVFATDVDAEALNLARAGSYPESIVDEVGPQRLTRFFEKQGDRYVVRKVLRESVVFAPQDLVRDPPFSKLDLIVCRNVLIYFEPAQQSRILEVFHFALNPKGVLFLGKSESLGQQADLFEPISRTSRIFRRVGATTRLPRPFDGQWSGPGGYLTPATGPGAGKELDPAAVLREHLGERDVTAAVLVNRDYRALYFHGETSRFVQPTGEAAWDLLSLLRDGLRSRVRAVLQEAITSAGPAEVTAYVKREGDSMPVRIRVEPVSDYARTGLLVVSFDDAQVAGAAPDEGGTAELALEAEVRRLRAELAAAERESETTNAELRVANEEAMSLNEELQSSNEELQTSKEELQSMNEELASVNSELEDKIDELERALGDLRNFLDSTRVATLFLDREFNIRRFTPDTARLYRVLPSDEGRPLRDIVSGVADPGLLESAADVLRDLQPREAEVATGTGEWYLRRVLPYRARDDRIEGVVVTYVDITALRRAAQDARRLATVLNDSNDAVIVHDFAGRILFWNRGAERAYGYTREAALAMNIGQIEAPGAGASASSPPPPSASSTGPVITRRLTRDGRLRDVSITVSPLLDDAGVPYATVSTERDITEELRRESELRFRAMADDIPTLLRIEDAAGQAQFLNRAWLAYTGESAADPLLANGWFRYIHPDDLPGYVKGMGEARKKQTRFEGDMRLRRFDGAYRWMRTTAVVSDGDAGEPLRYVSVSVDIEERKRAEQAVAREGERKDEFLAMLAHELRNPLFPIANAVAVIEQCDPADQKIAWASHVIDRQTQQLARLVDDLMDVARIRSGKVALTREPIDVAVLVERARDLSQPLIEGRKQSLTVTLPPEAAYVEGDLVRLTQVLGNLLNNASKYSDQGGEIALTVTSSPAEVVFTVADHGAGISAEMLPHVFDLFAQEDKTLGRAQGGLGIGLSLVDRLVRAHGGSVEAHSPGRGGGSAFVVRLPSLPLREGPRTAHPVHASAKTGARRVLVVDDNVDGAESVAMLLEHAGHAVRTAKEGTEALRAATEFRPDIVLLDIGLPGMSGYDVARHLRGRAETSRALLIAMTGYGQAEDVAHSKASGFDHHLVKPVSIDALFDLVNGKAY